MGHPARSHADVTLALATAVLTLSTSCAVGPNYARPPVVTPAAYKELDGWKVAQPEDQAPRGAWWEIFNDPQLSALEAQVSAANQTLAVAAANYEVARALARGARAAYFPTVGLAAGATRSQAAGRPSAPSPLPKWDFLLSLDVAWLPDFWGRVRRAVESSRASAQASAGDLETSRLSLQAELAQDYFLLRTLDAQTQLLEASAAAYQKSLELTQDRHRAGVASRVDVVQAETQLKTTQATAIDVGVQRAELEHAIAVLTGEPPAGFSLPPAPLPATTAPPAIPVGVPSHILERRPDIAAAERRMAAANARIGVAVAAYFPVVSLGGSGGFESSTDSKASESALSRWLTWPSRFWSVGPGITEIVFDGGLRQSLTDQARATYDASVSAYRQTVLAAFQGVEDNLAALRILEEEARVQAEAVKAAQESVSLTTTQYKAGTVSYLNVITVQTIELANELTAVRILGRRMAAAVLLIEALGGGWSAASLPSAADVTNGSWSARHSGEQR